MAPGAKEIQAELKVFILNLLSPGLDYSKAPPVILRSNKPELSNLKSIIIN
jgi:hypothetical protein